MNIGCVLAFFAFAITVGAWLFDYCVKFVFGAAHALPWYGNVVGGLIAGEVTTPLAIVFWLLSLGGVTPPLVHP